jgi:hypothetical protein
MWGPDNLRVQIRDKSVITMGISRRSDLSFLCTFLIDATFPNESLDNAINQWGQSTGVL